MVLRLNFIYLEGLDCFSVGAIIPSVTNVLGPILNLFFATNKSIGIASSFEDELSKGKRIY